jgi:hypothetical protein
MSESIHDEPPPEVPPSPPPAAQESEAPYAVRFGGRLNVKRWLAPLRLLTLALAPVVAVAAWFFAAVPDSPVWGYGVIGSGLLVFGFAVGGLAISRSRRHGPFNRREWALIGCGAVLWAVWTAAGAIGPIAAWISRQATVYVDNFSARRVRLEVDGSPWVELQPGETTKAQLSRWGRELVTRDAGSGEELDRRPLALDGDKTLLNVLGAGAYERGVKKYSMLAWGPDDSPAPQQTNAVWINADVDFLFQDPPQFLAAKDFSKSMTRTYLKRLPPGAKPRE